MAEKVKIGIIGAGIWGRNHALALATHPRGSIELICDRDETRARAAKRLDGEHRLIILEEAVKALDAIKHRLRCLDRGDRSSSDLLSELDG